MDYIVDNKKGLFNNEVSVFSLLEHYIDKSLESNQEISIYLTSNFVLFESFKELLPKIEALYNKKLLKHIYVLIGSYKKMEIKDFIFYLKNDSIVLEEEDFKIIKKLYVSKHISFRVNYSQSFDLKLYIIIVGKKLRVWAGTANFVKRSEPSRVELLMPVRNGVNKESLQYIEFFKKMWHISSPLLNGTPFIRYLEKFAKANILKLSPRNFIASLLLSIEKEYLVKNISFDLSSMSEIQNMGYYLTLEKLEKYGVAIFLNSLGLSKFYISAMIVKSYIENNKNVLILHSAETEAKWEYNLEKCGVNKDSLIFLERSQLTKHEFDSSSYRNLNLVIIDKAEYFSISKDLSNRLNNLKQIVNLNPNSHVLMISTKILNDSINDLLNILKLCNKGKFTKVLESEKILDKLEKLQSYILENTFLDEEFNLLKDLFEIFSIKTERVDVNENNSDISSRPLITTVKYAYDHEISVKLYERIQPLFERLSFEYSKLSFSEYHEYVNLTHWYKWRLYKRLESSVYAYIEALKEILDKCYFVLNMLRGGGSVATELFSTEQLQNIQSSFDRLSPLGKEKVFENIKNDVEILNTTLESIGRIKYLENRDSKITNLLKILKSENKPTVIFTESQETLHYIERRLKGYGLNSVDIIYGGDSTLEGEDRISTSLSDIQKVCADFNNKKFDILVANDVIDEGIFLERAEVIINFDISTNLSILSKRNNKSKVIGSGKKVKIYNFQADRRVDKEYSILESLGITFAELVSFYGIDFILWCKEEKKIGELSSENFTKFLLLTGDYKDFLAKRNPDEISYRFSSKLPQENIVLREFIKYLNISEETLKLTNIRFRKAIFTAFKSDEDYYHVIYKINNSIKYINNVKFSENARDVDFSQSDFDQINDDIEKEISRIENLDRSSLKLVGIIKYTSS